MPSRRRNALKKARKARKARDAKKKTAKVLHDKRNAQAHFEAEENKLKKKTLYLECLKFDNRIDLNNTTQIEDFFMRERLTEEINFRKMQEDIKTSEELKTEFDKRITKKINSLGPLYFRACFKQILCKGLQVTVVPDSYYVYVYIVVPVTHKNFKTCTNKFQNYTFSEVLDDGSKKFRWDFGGSQKMFMYNIHNLIMQHYFNPLIYPFYIGDLINKISSLEIITLKKIENLIIMQIAFL